MGDPKERPILFSGAMVRAILAGQKTVTRRVAKDFSGSALAHANAAIRCPYGAPGDRLWVRETFVWYGKYRCTHPEGWREADDPKYWKWDGWEPGKIISVDRCVRYVADGATPTEPTHEGDYYWRKTPSIHMPRTFSRITLDVVDVRVERLHAIDDEDAEREGVMTVESSLPPRARFAKLWDSINVERAPWSSDPWVWRVEFKRVTP
jgi:hypothetical protein